MPSGTSTSTAWSDPAAMTARRSDLRARYWRYQRHSQEMPNPSAAAIAMRAHAVGGSLAMSSTSTTLRSRTVPQRTLQRCQLGIDLGALRRPCKQLGERLRHGHLAADQRLDDLAEFRRMRRRYQQPAAAVAALSRQPRVSLGGGGGVRAPDLAELLIARAYAGADGLIVHGAGTHCAAQLAQIRI